MTKKEQVIEILERRIGAFIPETADQIDAIYNDSEFEFGKEVEVRDTETQDWQIRKYGAKIDGKHFCYNLLLSEGILIRWSHARKIQPKTQVTQAELIESYKKSEGIQGEVEIVG